jgi:polyribonucleotide nucleotidyltransferase
MAKQAGGAVTVRQGDTVVLVTACASADPRDLGFLPLTVEYREAMYAAGKIPGGFFKREGRPNEKETLTSRLIDRPIRPLLPKGWTYDTQIIAFVLSADREHNPDVLAVTGASFAVALSDIPLANEVAAVRVGLVDGKYVINPTHAELKESKLDVVIAASHDAIVMVEAGAKEATEAEILAALEAGQVAIQDLVRVQREFAKLAGKPKRPFVAPEIPSEITRAVHERAHGPLLEAMQIPHKLESYARVAAIQKDLVATLSADAPEKARVVNEAFYEMQDELLHEFTLKHRRRLDGRNLDQIRPISIEVGVKPKRWSSQHSEPRPIPSRSTGWNSTVRSGSCSTTTSRHSRWERSSRCAAPGGARSDTAHSPSARSVRSSRTVRSSLTPCDWSRRFSNRTARHQWPRSAAARWR